ncbi:MAG: hypothetical protein U0K57_02005 [Lachnospiraceae bacterium]|nr:hypothetical protein [Lachnospiraceae bacterium]
MKKKIALIFLAALMMLSFTGCGEKKMTQADLAKNLQTGTWYSKELGGKMYFDSKVNKHYGGALKVKLAARGIVEDGDYIVVSGNSFGFTYRGVKTNFTNVKVDGDTMLAYDHFTKFKFTRIKDNWTKSNPGAVEKNIPYHTDSSTEE